MDQEKTEIGGGKGTALFAFMTPKSQRAQQIEEEIRSKLEDKRRLQGELGRVSFLLRECDGEIARLGKELSFEMNPTLAV